MTTRDVATIDTIIIHCSDSGFGSREMIDAWHKARGWDSIGYHYVISNGHPVTSAIYAPEWDGKVEIGRGHEIVGAHAVGHNATSIGICLIGTAAGLFTPLQIKELAALVEWLRGTYNIPRGKVIGHRDVDTAGKTCPGFDVRAWA
jgi:N-acetyl-anhydromuramyl-L-alanine amidase AmpD